MTGVRNRIKQGVRSACLRAFGVQQRLRGQEAVLLTFDDGPEPGITEAILDRLRPYQARAVFFSVGYQVERAGHLLDSVRGEGHEIGNHSFAHLTEQPRSVAEVLADLTRCQSVIKARTTSAPRLYRPPLGMIRMRSLVAARKLSLQTVLWSVDSRDWQIASKTEAEERGRTLASTVSGGDIVLLHEHNEHVLTILDLLLPALAHRGLDLTAGLDLL